MSLMIATLRVSFLRCEGSERARMLGNSTLIYKFACFPFSTSDPRHLLKAANAKSRAAQGDIAVHDILAEGHGLPTSLR